MPRYDYQCSGCAWTGPLIVKLDDRDEQRCPRCDGLLAREEIGEVAPHQHAYQSAGIFGPKGARVPGHFGREAKRRRSG
jgi:putative FmdB family regulatory protein